MEGSLVLPKARVRLDGVPVALFLAAEQHQNDLLREIALMAVAGHETSHRYADLLAAADRYAHRPAAVRRRVAESVTVGLRAGWGSVTVDVEADEAAAEAALAWEDLLRRFDQMSRDDQLLTLPADAELVAFRHWYVHELVEQVRTGRAPVSWGEARVPAGAAG